jgi:hypothetical protein
MRRLPICSRSLQLYIQLSNPPARLSASERNARSLSAANGTIKRLSHADSVVLLNFCLARRAAFICQLSETIARTCRVASRRIVRFDLSRQPFRRNDEIALFGARRSE